MAKVRKAVLSFMYVICRLALFYISTKYHQNILKRVFELQSRHKLLSNKTKGNNSKSKKARVVILVHNMSSRPPLHFY